MTSVTANRLIKRKLRLSLVLLVIYIAVDAAEAVYGFSDGMLDQVRAFARLSLAAALINAIVVLVINPIREDRVPERFPTILQDAIVIALVLLAAGASAEACAQQQERKNKRRPTPTADAISAQLKWHSALPV